MTKWTLNTTSHPQPDTPKDVTKLRTLHPKKRHANTKNNMYPNTTSLNPIMDIPKPDSKSG